MKKVDRSKKEEKHPRTFTENSRATPTTLYNSHKSSSTNYSNSVTQLQNIISTISMAEGLAPNFEFEFPDVKPCKFCQFWF